MAMNLLTALFSTVGYCLLMNVPRNKIVPASINGMLSWGLYLLLKDHIESVFYLLVVVASFTAAYSEVAAAVGGRHCSRYLRRGGHPADHPPSDEPLTLLLLYHRKPRP